MRTPRESGTPTLLKPKHSTPPNTHVSPTLVTLPRSASKWLSALGVSKVITTALKVPNRDVMPAFEYIRKLKRTEVARLADEAIPTAP